MRRRVHAKVELGLLAIVHRQALKQERSETRASSSAHTVEDEKSLKTAALVSEFANAVKRHVNEFASNSVVSARVVVGGVFLSGDELLRMVELAISTSAHFVHDGGLQVHEDSARHVLARAGLREEGVERTLLLAGVGRHSAIRLNAVFQAVEFPAAVSNLNSGLSDMQRNDFTPEDSRK